jgi:hemin uptake protein HemP
MTIPTVPARAAAPMPALPAQPAIQPAPLRRFDSKELMNGEREVEINHGGRIYRLRITQLNKLILTA